MYSNPFKILSITFWDTNCNFSQPSNAQCWFKTTPRIQGLDKKLFLWCLLLISYMYIFILFYEFLSKYRGRPMRTHQMALVLLKLRLPAVLIRFLLSWLSCTLAFFIVRLKVSAGFTPTKNVDFTPEGLQSFKYIFVTVHENNHLVFQGMYKTISCNDWNTHWLWNIDIFVENNLKPTLNYYIICRFSATQFCFVLHINCSKVSTVEK